ncbi:MAG: thioredoxin domain-containing protein, partial [Pyrinomonadaceae bacterium]
MNNEQTKTGGLPLGIIGLVLIVAVVGGWWFYSSSKPAPAASNTVTGNANVPAAANAAKTPPAAPVNAPMGAQPPHLLGSPTASVTVEEFADFQCGGCAAIHPTLKEVQALYGSKIKLIFRNFPLPMHDKSTDAAVASEAAGMQGKFWDMQNQLFTNQQ